MEIICKFVKKDWKFGNKFGDWKVYKKFGNLEKELETWGKTGRLKKKL